ncbi:transglycosylase SLT domain-containing protein [Komagataeibacter europaeus]|uniref:transglycosylase SLT domain-containing protein n=1 Tax=Komagataeibacter europaeus TaxID=33995 RepID=UPI0002DB913D|nr:transglycosylase SLT domain-containing protein [Komagataeibacter europaeus]GBQ38933.1 Phage-related tail protein [Komagataeibacter europaeus LMG 18890]
MPNAGVKVVISAADRASQTIERINTRIARMQAPVRRVQAAFGRFASLSGLSRLNNGIVGVGRSALGAFQSLGQIVPVLGTLTGAASVAGVYRLASAWAQVGTDLRTTSRTMGMAPQKLQAMQNAAKLAGGSAESMTGALQQLSQTSWAASHNQDPAAAAQFRAVGVSMKELQTLTPDKLFQRVAARLREIRNPAAQAVAATTLFGGAAQGLMPIFQQTGREFERNLQLAERYGVMNQKGVDAANRMRQAQQQLGLAVEGFGNSLAQTLEPAITPVLQFMAEWIAVNGKWISQDIGKYVGQFVTWMRTAGWKQIKGDISSTYQAISNVVDRLGGWKSAGRDALIAIAALYAMPVLTGLASIAAAAVTIGTALAAISLPVAAAIAAVAALGVAGYELWSHWGGISKRFAGMWNGLKGIFQNNTGYVRTLTEALFPVPAMIINHWGHLGKFFSDMWDGIKDAFSSAWSYISPIVDKISQSIDAVSNSWIGKKIAAAAGAVEQTVMSGVSAVGSYDRKGMDWYAGYVDRITGYRSPRLAAPIQQAGIAAAQRYGLDPDHYLALLRTEGGGYNNVSKAGAFGPGQLMPATARGLGVADSINAPDYDWRKNLDASARLYSQLLKRAGGDYAVADASYNAGPYSRSVSRFAQTHDLSVLPKETQDYVATIARDSRSAPAMSVPPGTAAGTAATPQGGSGQPQSMTVHVRADPGTQGRVTRSTPGTRVVNQMPVQQAMPPALTPVGN